MLVTGAISGLLQEYLGYVSYFVAVMIATIPSFLATWFAPFNHDDGMGASDGVKPAPAANDANASHRAA
jgi:PAT family beta-lactamase induction signal transducer AmpG